MTAIWRHDDGGWRLMSPTGFNYEAALHDLVEEAPHTLPLAGRPRLTILGREVPLGANFADLIAVEESGRLAIIEIKLARSPEARRAVIAQVLTYAAYLRGLDVETLERRILSREFQKRGLDSISQAVQGAGSEVSFDHESFAQGLAESLANGRFRLVLVLDDAPTELIRLVGYLESVSDKLLIDLVTVSAYEVGGSQLVVPQRVDPERVVADVVAPAAPVKVSSVNSGGWSGEGAGDFEASLETLPDEQKAFLQRLADWAKELEREGLIHLSTWHGASGVVTLLPRLHHENVGLVTLYNEGRSPNGAYLAFNRSVFERRAPTNLDRVERFALPAKVGKGTVTREVSDQLLEALTDAYREAATGRLNIGLEEDGLKTNGTSGAAEENDS